jgi:predicted lipase
MPPALAAKLSALAYHNPIDAQRIVADQRLPVSGLDWFNSGGTEGFVASTDDFTVAVFRGTRIDFVPITWVDILKFRGGVISKIKSALSDIIADVNIHQVPWRKHQSIHAGFAAALDKVSMKISHLIGDRKNNRVELVGHSMGGALAQLYASRLIYSHDFHVGVTTFGCPGVGNSAFARYVHDGCVHNNNWHYCSDIVPRLLSHTLNYYLPGTLRYVNRNGKRCFHSTQLERLVDRSILRAKNYCRGKFDQDISHHSMSNWERLFVQ